MSSNWIDRMKKMELNPPEKGWEKVSAALDESLNGLEFPAKLHEAQVIPPAAVWGQVEASLNAENETSPVIPFLKRSYFPVIFRYAAAACIIALIAFGAVRLFNGSSGNTGTAQTGNADTVIPANTATNPAAPAGITPGTPENAQVQKDDEALEQSKQTYARLDISRKPVYSKLYKSPAQLASFASETTAKQPEIQYSHRAAVSDSPVDEADRYVMYRGTDGRFIRISKKLSELFCCVSGEVQDEKCTSQLKQWQEKIAASPFNPSPDNFMDILDLINSIQDNRN